jgi:hypothetical protein
MRSTGDLERITPLIWNELKILGVPFIRCGIFIINEAKENIQMYLSAPDGRTLAVLDLPFQATPITADIVDHWQKKIVYRAHWTQEDFISWTNSLMEFGQIMLTRMRRLLLSHSIYILFPLHKECYTLEMLVHSLKMKLM